MRYQSQGTGELLPISEPERPDKLGILNAVEERRITVPGTRERKVDFFRE